ncbi:2-oxoacid:acceptor oxidoreductase family protein [Elusimicrobiota bacterium]
MKNKIIISGFGGQGVMLSGTLLCHAGMLENKFVTFFPSYGAEMRGGTANCQVIISDQTIGAPVVKNPDILVSFNKPSFSKFSSKVKSGGLILANSSLYQPEKISSIEIAEIPANDLAEQCGSVLVLNLVMLGALASKTGILKLESITQSVPEVLSKKKNLWEINKKALEAGFDYLK